MTKNSLTHAPYRNGNLQEFVYRTFPGAIDNGEWRPNDPFPASLFYKTWQRGRSAVRVIWEDIDGNTYPMFMKDMDTLLTNGRIDSDQGAVVHGEWWVVKRGANYGIALVEA